jgi:hypothetical protein
MYAVGTIGDGSAATSLLTQAVTTDANGDFNIAGDYSGPSATSLVYTVAVGGNPGLAVGTNNTALTMMAALGACGNLTATTPIRINELTTVAAAWSLAPYMTSYSNVGSDTGDATALAEDFTLASYFADPSTGTVPGATVPTGFTVPVAQMNTLADILASCVDTTGGVVGDGSTCGTLFAAATLADLTLSLSPTSGLTVSPSALTFPPSTLNFPSAPQTITITNSSAVPINLNVFGFSGSDVSEFKGGGTDDCVGSLGIGASCTVQVVFTPTAAGSRSASLSIGNNGVDSPAPVSLMGTGVVGVGGPVTVSPASLTFNGVGMQAVTVTNTGNVPAGDVWIVGVTRRNPISGYVCFLYRHATDRDDFEQRNEAVCFKYECLRQCHFFNHRRQCERFFDDQYLLDQFGSYSELYGADNLRSLCYRSAERCSRDSEQRCELPPDRTVVRLRDGWIGRPNHAFAHFAGFHIGRCSAKCNSDEPRIIAGDHGWRYLRRRHASKHIADKRLRYLSGSSIDLYAMGTSLSIVANVGLAGASLSTSSLTFAAQTLETTSIPQVVTLTNTGDIVLIISGLNFSGVNSGDVPIESNTCGNTVAAGASCTIAISFSPTATGARAAALQILSNVESSPTVLQLSGTGN